MEDNNNINPNTDLDPNLNDQSLHLVNVCKDYILNKDTTKVLKNINLDFNNVEFISIIGPSGCGKTTLLNCIGGIDNITGGEIISQGKSLSSLTEKEMNLYRNNNIGFIFQNYYLIPQLNVLDNIKIALSVQDHSKSEVKKLAYEALKIVGMEKFSKKQPNTLSGGQKQKVAIARAIVTSPNYILADEPTGSLDSKSSIEVMDILKEISKTRLVIMVTHNLELAQKYSDRIIKMNDGEIIEDKKINETTQKLVKNNAVRQSHLSLSSSLKIALTNLYQKKIKTIFTALANSLGMIGIGFLISINSGFTRYSDRILQEASSSLPIVISSYDVKETWDNTVNKKEEFPKTNEIYPSVDITTSYELQHNSITPKYLNYIKYLRDEKKIVENYVISNGTLSRAFSYKLVTDFPESINGLYKEDVDTVNTTYRSKNSLASDSMLQDNLFHPLYGNMDSYQLLAGEMPKEKGDLVLIVDKYNKVQFSLLKALGFYNKKDSQNETVIKENNTNKVTPISFNDIIGKHYKLYCNDDVYTYKASKKVTDGLNSQRNVKEFEYDKDKIKEDFKNTDFSKISDDSSLGYNLTITGILRAKPTTSLSILSPSLCYSNDLNDELISKNAESEVTTAVKNNVTLNKNINKTDLQKDLSELSNIYSTSIKNNDLSSLRNKLNDIFNRNFTYYNLSLKAYTNEGKTSSEAIDYNVLSFYLDDCRRVGAELITEEFDGRNFADEDQFKTMIDNIRNNIEQSDTTSSEDIYSEIYKQTISLIAYVNQYSYINALVIFPTSMKTKDKIKEMLDEYNNIQYDESGKVIDNDPYHACKVEEKVSYVEEESLDMIEDVKNAIILASAILLIFAIICLIISCSLTAILIYNSVVERTKEIGLLRALGTRKIDVIKLFEIEALFIGAFSGILGALLTLILSYPLNAVVLSLVSSSVSLGNIIYVTPLSSLIVVLASILISFIAALVPSFLASKVTPIDSLRKD